MKEKMTVQCIYIIQRKVHLLEEFQLDLTIWFVVASCTSLLTEDVHEVYVKSEDKRRAGSFKETKN